MHENTRDRCVQVTGESPRVGGGFTASGKAIPSIAITCSSGDWHRFRVADRDAYTGVRAYWLDLNYGKKKKVSVRRRATTKKAGKSSSREGDYIEGAEGNVFIIRKPSRTKTPPGAQRRQNGSSYSAVRRSFRSPWRAGARSCTRKCTQP